MSKFPKALWLNTSPSLLRFDRPLLSYLSQERLTGLWEYQQTPDEPCSLKIAVSLLHDYLKSCDRPIHLVGHSTGGLIGLLYAQQYPERVKSLSLLGVGSHPGVNWQTHYYSLLSFVPCSRQRLLTQMVFLLFGDQHRTRVPKLLQMLEKDLLTSPSPHSLYHVENLSAARVPVPLMVCTSEDDMVIDPQLQKGWEAHLKPGDRLWQCPEGRHFFHYFNPKKVGQQVLQFWYSLPSSSEMIALNVRE